MDEELQSTSVWRTEARKTTFRIRELQKPQECIARFKSRRPELKSMRLVAFICGEPFLFDQQRVATSCRAALWVQKIASVSPFSTVLFVNRLLDNDLASSNPVAAFASKGSLIPDATGPTCAPCDLWGLCRLCRVAAVPT